MENTPYPLRPPRNICWHTGYSNAFDKLFSEPQAQILLVDPPMRIVGWRSYDLNLVSKRR